MREAHDEFCDLTGGIYVTNRAVLFCKKNKASVHSSEWFRRAFVFKGKQILSNQG